MPCKDTACPYSITQRDINTVVTKKLGINKPGFCSLKTKWSTKKCNNSTKIALMKFILTVLPKKH